jgi:hypothetical protein
MSWGDSLRLSGMFAMMWGVFFMILHGIAKAVRRRQESQKHELERIERMDDIETQRAAYRKRLREIRGRLCNSRMDCS